MSALRTLLRIEWRDAVRHRGRTALVIALVALAVATTTVAGTLMTSLGPAPDALARQRLGTAALRIDGPLPRGVAPHDVESHSAGEESVGLPDGERALTVRFTALDAPGLDGLAGAMFDVIAGRAPRTAGEVAVSSRLADVLDVALGDRLVTGGEPATLVGLVDDPLRLDALVVVHVASTSEPRGAPFHLVDAEAAARVGDALGAHPVMRRAELVAERDGFESLATVALGAFVAFEVALVLVATFAVGAARRRRRLGLVAACGARPTQAVAAASIAALAQTALGALVGVVLAQVAWAVAAPELETSLARRLPPLDSSWIHAAAATGLAGLAVAAAVVLPVRRALATPVVTLLRARRGASRRPTRVVAAGALAVLAVILVVAAPTTSPALALAGAAAWTVAAVLAVPRALEFAARAAERLPLAPRLAARDAARMHGRWSPVVVGVLAVAAVALQLVVLIASVSSSFGRARLDDDQLLLRGPDAASLARSSETHVVAAAPLRRATHHGRAVVTRDGSGVFVGDDALIAVLDVTEAPVDIALDDGTALSAPRVVGGPYDGVVVATEALASTRGWLPAPPEAHDVTPWLLRADAPFDDAFVDRLRARASSPDTQIMRGIHDGIPTSPGLVALVLATALAVVALVTGLGASESSADAATLHRAGAPPSLLARVDAARAVHLALVGVVLALPTAVVPAVAWTTLADASLTLTIPWGQLLLLLLGLPLSTGAGMLVLATARRSSVPARAA